MTISTAAGFKVRDDVQPLPVLQAAALAQEQPESRWLIESIWPADAVGVIGGHPKSCKTFWGLELAVSVATGTACLGRFQVKRPGRVLIYLAEDPAHAVRDRLSALCAHRGLSLSDVDLHVIVAPRLKLDANADLRSLDITLAKHRPVLLVLDPLVRLHSRDESIAHEITPVLDSLRILQRRHHLAIALVHHARKNAHRMDNGQGLRGSGDIFAWADVLHYLNREAAGIRLIAEHRTAPAPDPITLKLVSQPPHLEIVDQADNQAPSLEDRVLRTLATANEPIPRTELRGLLAVNNQRLGDTLLKLESLGRIRHTDDGWHV